MSMIFAVLLGIFAVAALAFSLLKLRCCDYPLAAATALDSLILLAFSAKNWWHTYQGSCAELWIALYLILFVPALFCLSLSGWKLIQNPHS